MTKIKICGITSIQDARYCVRTGADFLGFIFVQQSPRYISPEKARSIIKTLRPGVSCVGVFVDQDAREIARIARQCGLRWIQLHGEKEPKDLPVLKNFRLIRALRVKKSLPRRRLGGFDFYLFDTFQASAQGGTGRKFDWRLLKKVKDLKRSCFVSGGLSPVNVGELLKDFRPFAVDASSSLESSPGKKDHQKVSDFIKAVRRGETSRRNLEVSPRFRKG